MINQSSSFDAQFPEFVSVVVECGHSPPIALQCILKSLDEAVSTIQSLPIPLSTGSTLSGVMVSPNLRPSTPARKWQVKLSLHSTSSDNTTIHDVGLLERRGAALRYRCNSTLPGEIDKVQIHAIPQDVAVRRLSERAEEIVAIKVIRKLMMDEAINPRKGSMRMSDIDEEMKKRDPDTHRVMFPTTDVINHNGWIEFFDRHPDVFSHFKFNVAEIKTRGLSHAVSSDDVRVALKPLAKGGKSDFDMPISTEMNLLSQIKSLLDRDGTQSAHRVFFSIPPSKDKQYLSPSFSILMRMLQRRKTEFYWSTDPAARSRVGLLRLRDVPGYQNNTQATQQTHSHDQKTDLAEHDGERNDAELRGLLASLWLKHDK